MDASDLRVFEAVVRLGSMSRASQELNTVQSNVTTRIRALEEELGVELFHRTNRGVTPTPAARRLLPYTTIVARVLADARRAAMDDGTPAGPLVVGSLETTAAMRLSPVLARYTAAHPDVDLTLRTGTSCELVDQVLGRQLDGAFVCGPVNHPAVAEDVYFDEELVVLTAPGVTDLEAYLARPKLKIIVLRAGCTFALRPQGCRRGARSGAGRPAGHRQDRPVGRSPGAARCHAAMQGPGAGDRWRRFDRGEHDHL